MVVSINSKDWTRTMNITRRVFLAVSLFAGAAYARQPDPPGQVSAGRKPVNEAYLFAHMTHSDYGRLYYSVS
ncbi:MAG: hypothetical protein ACREUC_04545, partial [Steroidobacteraceae bacterium]